MTFKREGRYIVLKLKDLNNLPGYLEDQLELILSRVAHYTKPREYVVVESDWPEYEPVWKMIEERCHSQSNYK